MRGICARALLLRNANPINQFWPCCCIGRGGGPGIGVLPYLMQAIVWDLGCSSERARIKIGGRLANDRAVDLSEGRRAVQVRSFGV